MDFNLVTEPIECEARPLSILTKGLVRSMHRDADDELPRLRDLTARVFQRDGHAYHDTAVRLMRVLEHFRDEIAQRLIEETQELSLLIDIIERGEDTGDMGQRLASVRTRLELEQLITTETLDILRSLTDWYQPPDDACRNVRDLYAGLERLDHSIRSQLMLENTVLFPRASALAATRRS